MRGETRVTAVSPPRHLFVAETGLCTRALLSECCALFRLLGLQFWGQMSSNPRDPTLLPGEKCDCCLMNYSMHPRYVKAGLPQWVGEQVKQGYDVGYCECCPRLCRTLARR